MSLRVRLIVVALFFGVAISGCSDGIVGSDYGVRDGATAPDIALVLDALRADHRVDSADYITPDEMAESGDVATTERVGDVVIENAVPNGYISIELKRGYGVRDLDQVWDAIRMLPVYDRVLEM